MRIQTEVSLGELVDKYPKAAKILLRHKLDFCCGGRSSLSTACEESGIHLDTVCIELERSLEVPEERSWSEAPIDEIVAHILNVYHAPLPEELNQLEEMMGRVYTVHGHKDPKRLKSLKETVFSLSTELICHLQKEEQILFPWILSKRQPPPAPPI